MSDKDLKRWTRHLTLGLLPLALHPHRVSAKRDGGLLLDLAAEGQADLSLRFHLQPGPQGPEACWDLLAGPFDEAQRTWLASIEDRGIGLAGQSDWLDFLAESGGLRFSSGESVLLRITRRCNATCSFCNARGMLHDLAEEDGQRQKFMDQAIRKGYRQLSLTGGEPTLLPDLAHWIRRAKHKGFEQITLQTNGVLLADPEKVDELCEAGLDQILLSLHAGEAELHDQLLGLDGAFEAIEKAVSHIGKRDLKLGINCVVCQANLQALPGLVQCLSDWSLPELMLSFVSADALNAENFSLLPRIRDAGPAMEEAIRLGCELGIRVRVPGLCGLPICCLDESLALHFDELLDDRPPPRIPSRRYATCCAECDLRKRCSGFWIAYLDAFGEEELSPRRLTRELGP